MYHVIVLVPGESIAQLTFESRAAADTVAKWLLDQGYKSLIVTDNQQSK